MSGIIWFGMDMHLVLLYAAGAYAILHVSLASLEGIASRCYYAEIRKRRDAKGGQISHKSKRDW